MMLYDILSSWGNTRLDTLTAEINFQQIVGNFENKALYYTFFNPTFKCYSTIIPLNPIHSGGGGQK